MVCPEKLYELSVVPNLAYDEFSVINCIRLSSKLDSSYLALGREGSKIVNAGSYRIVLVRK